MTTEGTTKNNKVSEEQSDVSTTKEAEVLEEDDEFEEFEDEEWTLESEETVPQEQEWEEDWDDEAAEDDFVMQLRSELRNQGILKEAT